MRKTEKRASHRPRTDHYNGAFHAEQDLGWEPQMDANKKWTNTKRTTLKTWTIYERVGNPVYQTPRFTLPNESAAIKKLKEL